MFLEILIMFFEFIRCQNIYRNFSGIFESIYNILSTKYGFLGFSNFKNSKIRILTEFSSHQNTRYIYMSGFISSSPFQNTKRFLQIQSLAPGIARRSSGRLQLRRQLRRAITPNPCIVYGIRGYRCVRLVEGFVAARSVCRLDPRISSNRRIFSRLQRGSSYPVSFLHGFQPNSSFLLSSLRSPSLSLPPPRIPGGAALALCVRSHCPRHRGGGRTWRPSGLGHGSPRRRRGLLQARPSAPCAHGAAARPGGAAPAPAAAAELSPCVAPAPSPWP
jgi:hypothetical protein